MLYLVNSLFLYVTQNLLNGCYSTAMSYDCLSLLSRETTTNRLLFILLGPISSRIGTPYYEMNSKAHM